MKLIVLDDEEVVVESIRLVLRERFQIFTSTSFSDAIELLHLHSFDGAIVDLDLKDPQANGLDFVTQFRKHFPNKPVVLESGYDENRVDAPWKHLSPIAYLQKPMGLEDLMRTIDRLFF